MSAILDLFLRFNLRLEGIVRRLHAPLYVTFTHLLLEILQREEVVASELTSILALEKSTLSRLIATAENRGIVKTRSHPSDKRRKLLRVTAKGQDLLKQDNYTRNRQVRECIEGLPASKHGDLAEALATLADGMGASLSEAQPQEHAVRVQIRRLTRAMGFLGHNFLESGLAVETFQVLHRLHQRSEAMSQTELGHSLPYVQSSLSRLIDSLARRGWVTKSTSPEDRRKVLVALTIAGRKEYMDRRALALARLAQGLVPHAANPQRFIALLEGFLGDCDDLPSSPSIRVTQLESAEERATARALLMEELVRTQRHLHAPPSLIAEESICLGAFHENTLVGVLEIAREEERFIAVNFCIRSAFQSAEVVAELWLHAADAVEKEARHARLAVPARLECAELLAPGRVPNRSGDIELRCSEIRGLLSTN